MPRTCGKKHLFYIIGLSTISLFLLLYSPDSGPLVPRHLDKLNSLQPVRHFLDHYGRRSRTELPWYFKNGTGGASNVRYQLFPSENPNSDRIEDQLLYVPETKRTKVILAYNGHKEWSPWRPFSGGQTVFRSCPVKDCILTANRNLLRRADALLFKANFTGPTNLLPFTRPEGQVWILVNLESPLNSQQVSKINLFNWTATYRWDSELVYPYAKWVYYNESVTSLPLKKNYAANKLKKVAWFVSNCDAKNKRLEYAKELQKYISVDIFGSCGTRKCPRSQEEECFKMLNSDYKFYLSFENSNCKDYITEKFFFNGLGHDVIPIAMGARPEDYARSAPLNSYILVDYFDSPRELAKYLHILDKNDTLYNSYFSWKGTGEFIDTHFFCRLCTLLHDNIPVKSYQDINSWWGEEGVCTTGSWIKKKTKLQQFWDWLTLDTGYR